MLQDYQGVTTASNVPSNINAIKFSKGDVLLSNIRPYLKKVWCADRDGGCSADVLVFKALPMCASDFFHHIIANDRFINFAMGGAKGVKMPRGDKEQMKTYKIGLPSIEEQKKIAKFLSLLDERIATQSALIERLETLIRGINQNAFTGNGASYKLEEICEIRSGYSGNQISIKKGLKVSRIETISDHKINMERIGYVEPFNTSDNYRLQIGDILFSNINSVQYIGNTAFVDKDYNLYHGMNLLRLIPNNNVIPFYLYLLLNTSKMLNGFKTICNKAVSQASINQTELGKTIITLPSIERQKQICDIYKALYSKLETERNCLSLLQGQKQYLLRQMFI